jgi:DNA-binding CsgD family transcriptional regulator
MLHLSPSMERHFGDAFIVRNGYLTSWDPQASSLLAETIERALAYGPVVERVTRPVAVPRRNGRPPLLVRVVPISGAAHDVFMLARAVLIVADPTDARSSTVETIATMLGLSGAEARMALQIASGQRLQDIADIERITIETARSRLKSVFAKTGTHRQVELAVLIANLSRQD